MVKYFPGGEEEASNYTANTNSKSFIPICPFCGRLGDKPTTPNKIYHLHGISCICKDGISIPNKMIRGLMEQALKLGIISSYEKEYKEFDENGIIRRFDIKFFDLYNNPYFIEMDGGGHGYIIRKHSNKPFTPLPAKMFYSDLMKDNIAAELMIPLIRIDCFKSDTDYIMNELYKSELSAIINLDKIDWIKLEEICFNSLMTDVCNYRNENPELFSSEVAEIFGISPDSVKDYWKKGTKLGLCEYNPEKEFNRRNSLKRNWHNSIKLYVENLDDGKSWAFDSMSEFCRDSSQYLDGDKLSRHMLEKRFNKVANDYFIYDSGLHEYLIWKYKE